MADQNIHGLDDVQKLLLQIKKAAPTILTRACARIGLVAQSTAKSYAPRSPTMAQHSATLKRKKRTASRKYPGGLEKSIEWEPIRGSGAAPEGVSIFVAANGYSVSPGGFNYAPKIHDERGRTWHNLGPGSIAKNTTGKVGEKFIERAIKDKADAFWRILLDEAQKQGVPL